MPYGAKNKTRKKKFHRQNFRGRSRVSKSEGKRSSRPSLKSSRSGLVLPSTVRPDIESAISRTRGSNREISLTFCALKNKKGAEIESSSHAFGDAQGTDVEPCNRYDAMKGHKKVGDFHTHPGDREGYWITPSPQDVVGNIEDSYINKNRQMSCISSPKSQNIHCFRVKRVPSKDRLILYRKGLSAKQRTGLLPYRGVKSKKGNKLITDSAKMDIAVSKDFDHAWFNRNSYNRVSNAESIASDAIGKSFLGGSGTGLHGRAGIKDLDIDMFCGRIIQGYNAPGNSAVGAKCRSKLSSRLPDIPRAPVITKGLPEVDFAGGKQVNVRNPFFPKG